MNFLWSVLGRYPPVSTKPEPRQTPAPLTSSTTTNSFEPAIQRSTPTETLAQKVEREFWEAVQFVEASARDRNT